MAVVEAPTIKAPRGATCVFTRRVASALISVIGVVTLILMLAERWPVYDALYFTTTTLATIGFGDLRPITKVGRGHLATRPERRRATRRSRERGGG